MRGLFAMTLVLALSLPTFDAHASHCRDIPHMPQKPPDMVESNNITGMVTVTWYLDKTHTTTFIYLLPDLEKQMSTPDTVEVSQWPLFYIYSEKGKVDQVWVDRGLDGNCEQIVRYK